MWFCIKMTEPDLTNEKKLEAVVQFSRTDVLGKKVGLINAQGPPVPIPNTEVKLCSA